MKLCKKAQRFLAMLVAVVLLATVVPMNVVTCKASTTEFAGGRGTATDPYLIETKEHLNNVRKHLNAHYKMIADIIFTEADFAEGGAFYYKGAGWSPIKSPTSAYTYFTGFFDGNGYAIHNLTITADADVSSYVGLFAGNKGTIINLGLENCNIMSSNDEDVFSYVGGIVGYNYGSIANCYTTGNIIAEGNVGSSYVGGIVGWNNSGVIKECYNMAAISSTYEAGGISAQNYGKDSVIENCFNTGIITAKKNEDVSSKYAFSGGIVGSGDGIINCCYNIGPVVSSSCSGGISALGSTMTNCYYLDSLIVGDTFTYDGVTKCTLDHLKSEATFGNFNFQEIWTMGGDENYPYPELLNTHINFKAETQGIVLLSLPYKTEYYVGLEELDVTGGKIAIVSNDGTYDEVNLEESMVSGFDNSRVGNQTLTVKYNSKILTFDVEHLSLVYDHKITTDDTITLEFSAKKRFEFILSDEVVAKITNVQSSTIQWGSSIQMTSAATITPIKPGYVVVRSIDTEGKILAHSLLLIEEGSHQMQFSKIIKETSCAEEGLELHCCKFCGHQEERTIDKLEHVWDEGQVEDNGDVQYSCTTCDETYTKVLSSIEISKLPSKLLYVDEESLFLDDMEVTAYYSDGSSEIVEWDSIEQSGIIDGVEVIKVLYKNKSATFEIFWEKAGDLNGDETVTDADALYLLYHTIFGASYPIEQDCDYNNDGSVTDADALYLLYHTIFGDSYPLN